MCRVVKVKQIIHNIVLITVGHIFKMKKTYLEKMGLKPALKLTKAICKNRVSFLRRKIKKHAFRPTLMKKAKYYVSWYEWRGKKL